jgi:hypothetical protein
MTWLLLVPLAVALWWLWDIRRALRLGALPARRSSTALERTRRPDFPGAVPPNRYVVVRWPMERLEYAGCIGAKAREVYEHSHPGSGEEVEFWELGVCRGHK